MRQGLNYNNNENKSLVFYILFQFLNYGYSPVFAITKLWGSFLIPNTPSKCDVPSANDSTPPGAASVPLTCQVSQVSFWAAGVETWFSSRKREALFLSGEGEGDPNLRVVEEANEDQPGKRERGMKRKTDVMKQVLSNVQFLNFSMTFILFYLWIRGTVYYYVSCCVTVTQLLHDIHMCVSCFFF